MKDLLGRLLFLLLASGFGAMLLGGIAYATGGNPWAVGGIGALFCGWSALPGVLYRS